MSELKNTIKAALAAALGALCAYGVQLLVPVLVLVVVMLLDYATGMAKAWNAGELSSRVGLRGILKKVGYVATVGVAAVVDWLLRYGAGTLGWDWPVKFLFATPRAVLPLPRRSPPATAMAARCTKA